MVWQMCFGKESEYIQVNVDKEAQCDQLPCSSRSGCGWYFVTWEGRYDDKFGQYVDKGYGEQEEIPIVLEFYVVRSLRVGSCDPLSQQYPVGGLC